MGIGSHIVGAKKLRRLQRLTGLPLDRAYVRTAGNVSYAEGVVWIEHGCTHYELDPKTGDHREIIDPYHWSSCPDGPATAYRGGRT